MGLFSFLNLFKKKPKETPVREEISRAGLSSPSTYTPVPSSYGPSSYGPSSYSPTTPSSSMTSEFATSENIKAKLDLLMTQIDSIRIQHDAMNEKLNQIEKMLREFLAARRY